MTNVILFILFTISLSSFICREKLADSAQLSIKKEKNMVSDLDYLDAYKLKIGETLLFGTSGHFIKNIGIPNRVRVYKNDYTINSQADLDKAIATADVSDIITFYYPGVEMWYGLDNSIIPFHIDFRKTDKSVQYGETIFDQTYTLESFRKQFPKSAHPTFSTEISLFEITTQEKNPFFEHFLIMRKSKDDPDAEPMIEFTFEKGRLIFIEFANF